MTVFPQCCASCIFHWISPWKEERTRALLSGRTTTRTLINWSKLEHSDRFIDRATDRCNDRSVIRASTDDALRRLDGKILFYRWRGTHSTPRENNWKSIFVDLLAFGTHYRILDNTLPEINFVITELTKGKRRRERGTVGGGGKKCTARVSPLVSTRIKYFHVIMPRRPIDRGSLFALTITSVLLLLFLLRFADAFRQKTKKNQYNHDRTNVSDFIANRISSGSTRQKS